MITEVIGVLFRGILKEGVVPEEDMIKSCPWGKYAIEAKHTIIAFVFPCIPFRPWQIRGGGVINGKGVV